MKSYLYYVDAISVDFSRVKDLKNDYETKSIIFEFNSRVEFRVNPETDEEEMLVMDEAPVSTLPL